MRDWNNVKLNFCAFWIVVGVSVTTGGLYDTHHYRPVRAEASPGKHVGPSHEHGGVVMGVPNNHCDNATWKLYVDWDYSTNLEYRCQPDESPINTHVSKPKLSCLDNEDIPTPLHLCMTDKIVYTDEPPRGGPHRPLWPVYGEYIYLPPQRWVHALEHGAAVFLYHPCADRSEIELLKSVARSCLRRHIITPYRHLQRTSPLAILTYGCKLTMSQVNVKVARQFVQENALNKDRASEFRVFQDGQYSLGLLHNASIVSDEKDTKLCPAETRVMMREETMI